MHEYINNIHKIMCVYIYIYISAITLQAYSMFTYNTICKISSI